MPQRDCPHTIPDLLDRLHRQFADIPAIIDPQGSLTFAGLYEQSGNLARHLLKAGIGKGTRVGILMPNTQDFVVALFSVLRIGACGVLMSTLSRPGELAQMLRAARVDTLLFADTYLRSDYVALLEQAMPGLAEANASEPFALDALPDLRAALCWGRSVPRWAEDGAARAAAPPPGMPLARLAAAEVPVAGIDEGVVIFTSGSSAEPKAVIHSQANLVRQGLALAGLMEGCKPGDRMLSTMPFFWVGGLCTILLAALCAGTTVLCPENPSLEASVACLKRHRGTHIMHWPQQLELMRDDPAFRELLKDLRPAYGQQLDFFGLAPVRLTPRTLGMTETLGPHSMYPLAALPADKAGSHGLAVGGIERRIIDRATGAPLGPGEYGLLCLRGGALMTGMVGKRHDEVFDAEGFYHTDDVAMIDADGHLFFRGREGDIVKISGANVSPMEVEAAILDIPGIKAACIVALPLGGDERDLTLAAAIVAEDGSIPDPQAIRAALRERLSSYKVPRHVVVMREEDLPMTVSAKIYKPRLKEILLGEIANAARGR